jgi:LacI family transcriptional regulator
VIEGIDAEILERGLRLRFVYSVAELENDELRGEMVRPDVISGLIGVGLGAPALVRLTESEVTPIVAVEGPELYRGIDYVSVDKESGVRQLMEHLWSLGHRHFAFIGPPEEERFRRFCGWAALAGVAQPVTIDTQGWDMSAGYAGMQKLLQLPRDRWPTATMAACDSLAVGALRAARELEVDVPGDMAVVGFDNTMGAYSTPPLTTISVQREQLGRMAVRRLIERQQHPGEPVTHMTLATELVVRESSGMPLGVELPAAVSAGR